MLRCVVIALEVKRLILKFSIESDPASTDISLLIENLHIALVQFTYKF